MITALLCGRKMSKGLRDKNIYPVLGRPLCWYPLQAAAHSKYIDRIYVSTDSEKINRICGENAKNCRSIPRPDELATDAALLEDVLKHGFDHIEKDLGKPPEALVILLCNAATVLAENIDKAIEILGKDKEVDSVATVNLLNQYSPIRAKKIVNGRLVTAIDIKKEGLPVTCDRNCMGDIYFCDGSLWVVRPRCMDYKSGQLPFCWMGANIVPIVQKGGLDVDDEEGIYTTEKWLMRHGFTQAKTPYNI